MKRICLQIFIISCVLFAVQDTFAQQRSTIIKLPKSYRSTEIITGDTVVNNSFKTDYVVLPGAGSQKFTAENDSNYTAAFRHSIPNSNRFKNSIQQTSGSWLREQEAFKNSTYSIIEKNLQISPKVLKPSAVERTSYEHHIRQSMHIPFVKNLVGFGYAGDLPEGPVFETLARINRMLGYVGELPSNGGNARGWDKKFPLSVRYSIEKPVNVNITILSVQADTIATFYNVIQAPGEYEFTWDGRDGNGRAMPAGEYIAEIRLAIVGLIRRIMIIHETAK